MAKCTKCGRDKQGHPQPLGEKCQLPPLEPPLFLKSEDQDGADAAQASVDSSDISPTEKRGTDTVLAEVISQLSKLTMAVQRISDDQLDIRSKMASMWRPESPARVAKRQEHFINVMQDQAGQPASISGQPSHSVSQDSYNTLFTGARINQKTMSNAQAGEYQNLAEYIPTTDPNVEFETVLLNEQLVHRPRTVKKKVDSLAVWQSAWTGYESVLMQVNPSLYQNFAKYRLFITELDQKYRWQSVYNYDCRHRLDLSLRKSLTFDITSMDIYVSTCLTTGAAKQGVGCSRCH